MKLYKATKNKKLIFAAGKTRYREQTFAIGFGRFCNNIDDYEYKDYLGIGLNLFLIWVNFKIMLPEIMQRGDEE